MRVMNNGDYELFERLVSLKQNELRRAMIKFLRSKYDNVIVNQHYLVAIGEIPIALVAHMDTVFPSPALELYYDRRKNVMWSPDGLGADDRAGVCAILKIIQAGLRPSIILTTDEEKGGIGACALAVSEYPFDSVDLKYMIELDRRGENDCVFYECYCPEFTHYVESFGFEEAKGSFSDISFLMSQWGICGVNLSVGYENEHSLSEILHVGALYDTIDKVKTMLRQEEIPEFEYDEVPSLYSWYATKEIYGQHCSKCKKLYSEYELIPVKCEDGTMKYYCPDCVVGAVEWCEECGKAFENPDGTTKICKECLEDVYVGN